MGTREWVGEGPLRGPEDQKMCNLEKTGQQRWSPERGSVLWPAGTGSAPRIDLFISPQGICYLLRRVCRLPSKALTCSLKLKKIYIKMFL